MPSPQSQLIHEWQQLLQRFPSELRARVAEVASAHRGELAEHFYREMTSDEQARPFLAHQKVKERLEPAMQRWIASVLAVQEDGLAAQVASQRQIGEIHARVDIPVSLVLRGARHLKQRLQARLEAAFPQTELAYALGYAVDSIDMAMELMSHAYVQANVRNSRAEEAYRLFSVSQNIGTERERQRAALLDWENQLMFAVASGVPAHQLPLVYKSEFGLWFRHKAHDSFQSAPEMQQIEQLLEQIDEVHLPAFEIGSERALEQLRDVREAAKAVHYLLDHLFERAASLESGRDALTQMLNRKFLPVVLGKQVSSSRKRGTTFAVLMLDVDHFKQINDTYGHEAGDLVLQQVAALLTNNLRAGDYGFRHGGEEFLLLLVDTDQASAMTMAERIRQRIADEKLLLPAGLTLQVTVSIGVALHDGHPDYQRTLSAADSALYEAKREGRNRCVLASL